MTVSRRQVAFALAVLIGLGAFAGSAAELWRIARAANYGVPPALVVALDGLAVVCVISLSVRRDWHAIVTLAATTALSVGLQVLAVPRDLSPDRYVSAVTVHALVPLASFMAVHLATRLEATPRRPRPRPAPSRSVEAPAPVEVAVPAPTPRRRGAPVEDLVPVARKLLAELDVSPHDIGRPRLVAEMRDAGHPIGSTKAEDLLKLLRSEVPS